MAKKFIVYLVNGTNQFVYDLKRDLSVMKDKYCGFSDEKCKKKVEFDPSEVLMWDEVHDNQLKMMVADTTPEDKPQEEFRSFIKLKLTDDEYLDINSLLENEGIDIDDTRAIAEYILRRLGCMVGTIGK